MSNETETSLNSPAQEKYKEGFQSMMHIQL